MRIRDLFRIGEERAEPEDTMQEEDVTGNELEDLIYLSRNERGEIPMTKEMVMQIPTVKGCIGFISNMICMLPIRLYERVDGDVSEVANDNRVMLLNSDTGDVMDPVQWKRAWIRDYFIGNGGFTYIGRTNYPIGLSQEPPDYGSTFTGLYYVDESRVSIAKNTNPIYKDYDIYLDGKRYYPFEFLRIMRDTRDGCHNVSLTSENELIFRVAYQSLKFENNLVERGGNKKGFVKSQKRLGDIAMEKIRVAFRKLYQNGSEQVIVLNNGMEFQESSNTSVEMQLNENKESNSKEICKLFNVHPGILDGTCSEKDFINTFTMACMPVMNAIITSLNRELLFSDEKKVRFFDFDTSELLKGSMKERYEAYKTALEGGFMNIDEVRSRENMKPLGFEYINIGLNSVLFNPQTKEIYNTNADTKADMENLKGGELEDDSGNQS